jgi:ubiquinone/menaquinone biosynthesis C-methylase UbiE
MSGDEQTRSTRDFFDREAASWAAEYRPGGHMADRASRFLDAARAQFDKPGRILDLGCGSGEIAAAFAAAGWQVTACDLSQRMIETARRRWSGEPIAWVALDNGKRLPFPSGQFDLLVCSSVLEYVGELAGYLAEIARVVRPGGWCCATVPDMRHAARQAETGKRNRALNPLLFPLLRLSPWRSTYEYLRLSINRMPLAEWTALFRAVGLELTAPIDCEHPLALVMARREIAAAESRGA